MIRNQFPLFQNYQNLIYLDNAATTQKHSKFISDMMDYYIKHNCNVNRSSYRLGIEASLKYDEIRDKCSQFINSKNPIIFTSGATESLNFIASTIRDVEEVIVYDTEHHSNIIPWRNRFKVTILDTDDDCTIDLKKLDSYLDSEKKQLISVAHITNVIGNINPIKEICSLAHKKGIRVVVDGAQAVGHLKVDVQDLDCDYYCFSGHKMYGPTGIGILYCKNYDLEVYQSGGGTVSDVNYKSHQYLNKPYCYEAGTPPIDQVFGLNSAINFIKEIGYETIMNHDKSLLTYALEQFDTLKDAYYLGNPSTSIISFFVDNFHYSDIVYELAAHDIAVRGGNHCASLIHKKYMINGSTRLSFAIYNTIEEIDKVIKVLKGLRI